MHSKKTYIIILLCSLTLSAEAQIGSFRKWKKNLGQIPDTITVVENDLDPKWHWYGFDLGVAGNMYGGMRVTSWLDYSFYSPTFGIRASGGPQFLFDKYFEPEIGTVYKRRLPWTTSVEVSYFRKLIDIDQEYIILTHLIGRNRKTSYWEGGYVTAKARWRIGIEAGFRTGLNYFDMTFDEYIGIDPYGNAHNVGDGAGWSKRETFYNYQIVSLGISFHKIGRVKAHSKKYDVIKDDEMGYMLYAKGLLGLNYKLDEVFALLREGYLVNGVAYDPWQAAGPTYLRMDLNENMRYIPAGFIIGASNIGYGGFGTRFTAEFGLIPGPNAGLINALYLDLKAGIRIGRLFE